MAGGAEADEAGLGLGDGADVAAAALQRIDHAYLGEAEVAVDEVEAVEERLAAGLRGMADKDRRS